MNKIIIVASSPKKVSLTYRLALFLQNQLQAKGREVELLDVREWLPLMEEGQPVYKTVQDAPEALRPLAQIMLEARAFIYVSPEYNGSYPYSLKRLFDSFPKQNGKVFGIATGSNGGFGGMRAAIALQLYTIALFGTLTPQMLISPKLHEKLDEEGQLLDEAFGKSTHNFLEAYLHMLDNQKS
jgi:NAD(P)H-dependent FMN reductase